MSLPVIFVLKSPRLILALTILKISLRKKYYPNASPGVMGILVSSCRTFSDVFSLCSSANTFRYM